MIVTYRSVTDLGRAIVKFVDRKDCTNILRVEKDVKYLDPSKLSFSKGAKIVISESLCPITNALGINVRSLGKTKPTSVYTSNGIIRAKLEENGPPKSITHMFDLINLFPDVNIDSLQVNLPLRINNS